MYKLLTGLITILGKLIGGKWFTPKEMERILVFSYWSSRDFYNR